MKFFKYTTVGILLLTSGFLFAFGSTPKAHAQTGAGLISAFSQGTAEGLASCASQFVAGEILGSITSKIGGAISNEIGSRLGVSTAVPVTDSGTQDKIQGGNVARESRASCLDGIMYATAQNILDQLADSTLHWVNSGFTEFGQPGNRAYIGDLQGFISNVGEQTFNQFVDEYERTGEVCNTFSGQVLESITNQHLANNPSPTGLQASDVMSGFSPNTGGGCELENLLGGEEATKAFLKGDFSAGGWEAFLHTSQNPNSSPIGAYLSQRSQLQNRIRQAQELDLQELQQNNGWLSAVACPDSGQELDSPTGQCRNSDGTLSEPVVETPGTVVNEAVNNLVGSDFRRLELADETNEIVAALAGQLVGNIIGGGGQENRGFFDSNLANRTDPLSNINEYSQGGYNGPVPVDHIASTTAEQIELEEEILSILQQLPTRDELRQLEARLNQCLVDEKISEEFQGQDIADLVQGLFATHQNIFPGSGLNREREIGPQKVDWIGNSMNWTQGDTYALDACGGWGNHRSAFHTSYVADVESGQWKGFICLPDDAGELDEDDRNFGAEFAPLPSSNTYINLETDSGSVLKPLDRVGGYSVPILGFAGRSLYRNPRNDRVKIDWNGGDFEWKYHDVFAGEFQRFLHDSLTRGGSGNREKLRDILNYSPDAEINRYGSTLCDGRTFGQKSYIVKPNDDQWTKQECRQPNNVYQWVDTGEAFDAFRMLDDIPATISQYGEEIETLIGQENYDNSYEEPAGGDNLHELLHDVQTLTEGNPDPAELSARKQAVDARFGRLFSRFHSEADLEAAEQALELMNKANNTSRYNQLLNHANINSCQLPSDWDTASSGSSGNGGSNNPGTGPQGPPVPNFDPPPSDFSALPAPSGDPTQIALVFMEGVQFDVWLNEQLVPASRDFDYELSGGAGVKVINLPNNLQTMRLDPDQVKVLGLNNDGFGGFAYKVVNKNPDFNMNTIHRNHDSSQGFWGNPASNDPLGIIVSRNGSTVYPRYPDPYFYQGYMFNPADLPERRDFESQWSDTGKVVFSFINYGQPANPPVRGLEDGYEGEDNQSNPPSISFFSANRVAPSYIEVKWEASADECVASSIPTVNSWNGPVGTSGSYAIFTSDGVYLQLTCSRDGSSTQSSYSVSGS